MKIKDFAGRTALEIAVEEGRDQTVEILRAASAKEPNITTVYDEDPFLLSNPRYARRIK